MKKNRANSDEIVLLLNNIKLILYLILFILVLIVILISIGLSNGKHNLNDQGNNDNEILEYNVDKFKTVNFTDLKKLISLKGTHVIYIGRETCSYCAMFIPIMEEAQEKYEFETNYFDISSIFNFSNNSIIDQEAYTYLSNLNEFFEENFLATPMVVIFKDGKFVDGTMGYQEINEYSSFLEKNNFEEK